MSAADSSLLYYVYEHFDPVTREVAYVGSGHGGRAWDCTSRSPRHKSWLYRLLLRGFTPEQFCRVCVRGLGQYEARTQETALIRALHPPLNIAGTSRMPCSDNRGHRRSDARRTPGRRMKAAGLDYVDTRDFALVHEI